MDKLQQYRILAAQALSRKITSWAATAAPESDAAVDALLRKINRLPARPPDRQPYEGLFKLPEEEKQEGIPVKATFVMDLRWSQHLLWGRFILFDALGNQLLNRAATSGQPGYQTPEHFWTRKKGPLPPGEYHISTEPYWQPELPGVEGWWFDILPWDVYRADGQSRSAFGLHYEAGALGTAGCPAVQTRAAMEEAKALLLLAKGAGYSQIPLEVSYGPKK